MMLCVFAQLPNPDDVISAASKYSWEAGVIAFLVVAGVSGFGYAAWKIGWYITYNTFGNSEKGTRGTLGEWVDSEKEWKQVHTDTLKAVTDRLDVQMRVCTVHTDTMKAVMDSSMAAQNAAMKAAQQVEAGNVSLAHIDSVLTARTDMIRHTVEGVSQLKGMAFTACDMFQTFVAREFPNSIGEVSSYLVAIKKKINDETN